jgi:hypothetical protein
MCLNKQLGGFGKILGLTDNRETFKIEIVTGLHTKKHSVDKFRATVDVGATKLDQSGYQIHHEGQVLCKEYSGFDHCEYNLIFLSMGMMLL